MSGQPCRASTCEYHPTHGTEAAEDADAPKCHRFRLDVEADEGDVDVDGGYEGYISGRCERYYKCPGCSACRLPTEAELAERAGQKRLFEEVT